MVYPGDCARILGTSALLYTASVCESLKVCHCDFLKAREIFTIFFWVMATVGCCFLMTDTLFKYRVVLWLVLMGCSVVWEFVICLVALIGVCYCLWVECIEPSVFMCVGYGIIPTGSLTTRTNV